MMLLVFETMNDMQLQQLMKLYEDGNRINVPLAFPDCTDTEEGLRKIEEGFTQWLRDDFFPKEENTYYVLEEEGQWVSTFRLTKIDDFYFLEALHTPVALRRRGYAKKLMNEVIQYLKQRGSVILRDNVRKDNEASLAVHRQCGFTIEQEDGIDYLDGQTYPKCYGLIYEEK
ncbi:MAG: GNAT family N-acetyltransferase [Oscillospiraceae bacterium]|nr:GNAT family N-acetyltransferase [Oscillospiraceae bacterium]